MTNNLLTDDDLFYSSILWDFLKLNHSLENVDLIFVLCSHDIRIAKYAAELWKQNYSNLILFSGGLNFFTKSIFQSSEAESFAKIAIQEGVNPNSILIESKSTNTGENVQFSKTLLQELKIYPKKIIAVQKPSMTRRVSLALSKQWSDVKFLISSPNYTLVQASHEYISLKLIINEIVGDFQRIIEYPKMGFQSATEIPLYVTYAYNFLIKKGYTLHLLNT